MIFLAQRSRAIHFLDLACGIYLAFIIGRIASHPYDDPFSFSVSLRVETQAGLSVDSIRLMLNSSWISRRRACGSDSPASRFPPGI